MAFAIHSAETALFMNQIDEILGIIARLEAGDFSARIDTGPGAGPLTPVIERLNGLAKMLGAQYQATGRIHETFDFIVALASLDFRKKLPVLGDNGLMDGLASGLNMLSEELKYSVVSKHELEAKNNLLELVANNIPGIVARVDREGRYQFVNSTYKHWFGKSKEEILGKTHQEILPADAYERARGYIEGALKGERHSFESQITNQDGEKIQVFFTHVPYFDSNGTPDGYFTMGTDITSYKKSQLLLSREQERFRQLVEGLNKSAILAITDLAGNITFANELFCQISGYSSTELIGANHRILNSGIHKPEFFAKMWETISDGRLWHGEICNRRKDGSLYWVETTIMHSTGPEGEPQYLSIRHDITSRKDAEAKLVQSSKLASLGEMSAGIAHEINNPLAIISAATSLLVKYHNEPEKLLPKIESIERATKRIEKIVSGLRKFSRSSDHVEHKPVHLIDILKETVILTGAKSRRHETPVHLEASTDGDIDCNEIEIEQILVNLFNNGIDAVKESPERWIRAKLFEEGDSVVLQIRDSGKGIPLEIQKKMFLPFFTTKKIGEGTGLGLSIVKGILAEHDATIEMLDGDPNTCFEIRFPKSKLAQQKLKSPRQPELPEA